jgi:hypothetical protein
MEGHELSRMSICRLVSGWDGSHLRKATMVAGGFREAPPQAIACKEAEVAEARCGCRVRVGLGGGFMPARGANPLHENAFVADAFRG